MKRGSQVTVKIEKTEFPSVGISEFEGKKLCTLDNLWYADRKEFFLQKMRGFL